MIRELLQSANLTLDDIDHWAIHPGGAKMIEVLKEKLQIPEPKLSITKEILSSCGNMSSPTVLFELSRIIDHGLRPGQWCLMTAFGAGLSMHACLLRG
jgi:predicted naringenin-chalcone synthase